MNHQLLVASLYYIELEHVACFLGELEALHSVLWSFLRPSAMTNAEYPIALNEVIERLVGSSVPCPYYVGEAEQQQ